MSDDQFDDGLVHSHHWASLPLAPPAPPAARPHAHVEHARTPSTVHNDQHCQPG